MIIDRLEYAAEYKNCLPHIEDALAYIRANPHPGAGKHEFPGGYLMYQTGTTRAVEDGDYEAHRKYIDVQVLLSGEEVLQWNRLEKLQQTGAYDPEKDKTPLTGPGSLLELKPGMFAALFPADAHKACRHFEGAPAGPFEKYVVKLAL